MSKTTFKKWTVQGDVYKLEAIYNKDRLTIEMTHSPQSDSTTLEGTLRKDRFDNLNITVAYFSNEPDLEFDDKAPSWLGDDWPFDDTFNDFESFTFRKGRGVLIVAVSDLTEDEMKLVNELVSESIDDQINSFEKTLRDEMRHAFSLLAQNGASDSIVHWSGYAGVTYTADYSLLGATFVAEGVVHSA